MKRTTIVTVFTLIITCSAASSASACLPYIPWLDPFAWFGFYGCGYGYNNGCCSGGYGGYAPPVYGYAPAPQPPLVYPTAPAPGCNCTGALPQQQQLTAVQVPVTTYKRVTQYVPQTTYRTQYQPRVAYAAPTYAAPTYGATAYGTTTPMIAGVQYPTTTAAAAAAVPAVPAPVSTTPSVFYPTPAPVVSPPVMQTAPNVARPYPAGDITGDHEFPTQSLVVPPASPAPVATRPIRPVSYGVTPRAATAYSAAVR